MDQTTLPGAEAWVLNTDHQESPDYQFWEKEAHNIHFRMAANERLGFLVGEFFLFFSLSY